MKFSTLSPTFKHNKMLDLINIETLNFQSPGIDLEKICESQMKIQEFIDSVNQYLAAKNTSESSGIVIKDRIKNHRETAKNSKPTYQI